MHEKHAAEIKQHAEELAAKSLNYDKSMREIIFAQCDDDWSDAELEDVWKLFK